MLNFLTLSASIVHLFLNQSSQPQQLRQIIGAHSHGGGQSGTLSAYSLLLSCKKHPTQAKLR